MNNRAKVELIIQSTSSKINTYLNFLLHIDLYLYIYIYIYIYLYIYLFICLLDKDVDRYERRSIGD